MTKLIYGHHLPIHTPPWRDNDRGAGGKTTVVRAAGIKDPESGARVDLFLVEREVEALPEVVCSYRWESSKGIDMGVGADTREGAIGAALKTWAMDSKYEFTLKPRGDPSMAIHAKRLADADQEGSQGSQGKSFTLTLKKNPTG